jgi:hypothetical protein
MAWVTPIYDRTMSDVTFALQKMQEWKNSGSTNATDLKGCFNASDMNRIEGNIRYLSDKLSSLYYFSNVVTKTWGRDGLPTASDINRLIQNTHTLISSFCDNNAPDLPTTLLTITDVNSLEENLYKIKMILDDMIFSYRECDTFYCGED